MAAESSYAEMVAALCRADAYPHAADDVVHIQTHISDVFLAGGYAYKVKKPVNFGFLDFTTRAKRLQACEDEVRLNTRLAPEVYLGVATIHACGGRYYIADMDDAAGDIVDYAVRMIRLPEAGRLDRVAARGELTREHMIDIARRLARFHAEAVRGPEVGRYAGPQEIAERVRQNFAQIHPYIDRSITSAQFDRLRDYVEAFLKENAALFAARIVHKRSVDGHGDLHLKNMCLHQGRVVIFDCIEFNAAFRCGDAIGDIAFLTMDLDARGLSRLGNVFLNAYLEQTQDYAGLALLDFYQAYRACVRGKVISFLLAGSAGAGQQAALLREAAGYFAVAQRYVAREAAGLLITCGVSGSGKTTAAGLAADILDGVVVRSDTVRKHLSGVALAPRRAVGYAQGIYSPRATDLTYETLLTHARAIIAAGRWAILDATYAEAGRRQAAAQAARSLGVPFTILYCRAPRAELERRLEQRRARGTDLSDADSTVLREQLRRFQAPGPEEGRLLVWSGGEDLANGLAPLVLKKSA
ncbi:MAG TPA: AAA family ATPase [Acidiferrobacterales bacterium]|nr:AAA family ATPase [Acidiferrobacterales bacterium]